MKTSLLTQRSLSMGAEILGANSPNAIINDDRRSSHETTDNLERDENKIASSSDDGSADTRNANQDENSDKTPANGSVHLEDIDANGSNDYSPEHCENNSRIAEEPMQPPTADANTDFGDDQLKRRDRRTPRPYSSATYPAPAASPSPSFSPFRPHSTFLAHPAHARSHRRSARSSTRSPYSDARRPQNCSETAHPHVQVAAAPAPTQTDGCVDQDVDLKDNRHRQERNTVGICDGHQETEVYIKPDPHTEAAHPEAINTAIGATDAVNEERTTYTLTNMRNNKGDSEGSVYIKPDPDTQDSYPAAINISTIGAEIPNEDRNTIVNNEGDPQTSVYIKPDPETEDAHPAEINNGTTFAEEANRGVSQFGTRSLTPLVLHTPAHGSGHPTASQLFLLETQMAREQRVKELEARSAELEEETRNLQNEKKELGAWWNDFTEREVAQAVEKRTQEVQLRFNRWHAEEMQTLLAAHRAELDQLKADHAADNTRYYGTAAQDLALQSAIQTEHSDSRSTYRTLQQENLQLRTETEDMLRRIQLLETNMNHRGPRSVANNIAHLGMAAAPLPNDDPPAAQPIRRPNPNHHEAGARAEQISVTRSQQRGQPPVQAEPHTRHPDPQHAAGRTVNFLSPAQTKAPPTLRAEPRYMKQTITAVNKVIIKTEGSDSGRVFSRVGSRADSRAPPQSRQQGQHFQPDRQQNNRFSHLRTRSRSPQPNHTHTEYRARSPGRSNAHVEPIHHYPRDDHSRYPRRAAIARAEPRRRPHGDYQDGHSYHDLEHAGNHTGYMDNGDKHRDWNAEGDGRKGGAGRGRRRGGGGGVHGGRGKPMWR